LKRQFKKEDELIDLTDWIEIIIISLIVLVLVSSKQPWAQGQTLQLSKRWLTSWREVRHNISKLGHREVFNILNVYMSVSVHFKKPILVNVYFLQLTQNGHMHGQDRHQAGKPGHLEIGEQESLVGNRVETIPNNWSKQRRWFQGQPSE
jgi:hypothetical protein